jgi:DNA primase large subunit
MAGPGAPTALDPATLAGRYPFLPDADVVLAGMAVTVGSLLEDPAYEGARALGRARALRAAEKPRDASGLEELAASSPELQLLSFLFARIALSAAPTPGALRRWAVAEAKASHRRLAAAPGEELMEVARRLGVPFEVDGERATVALPDYVRLAAPIREAEFRLARQDVSAGRVSVTPKRAARLLQEAARRALAVPIPLRPEVVELVRSREKELLTELAERIPLPVARVPGAAGILRDRFPPCIRRMQRTLEKGENLSHAGRFCLAAFLHRAGADFETIVDAYRGAPDFDESVTRYQVEHITSRDGGLGYQPPECDTLRSHGLCARDGEPGAPEPRDRARDPLCFEPSLRHPLQYYRRKGGVVLEPERDPDRPSSSARRPRTG